MTYINSTQRRANRAAKHAIAVRIVEVIAKCTALVLVAFFISLVLINWISGCGEQFPTANGGYVQGECISPLDLFTRQQEK